MMSILQKQGGMTLVELLVASTLGILVSTAVAGFFLQSKQSFAQNDEISFLQDNGRYALKMLSTDIEMSDYWGGLTDPSGITTTLTASDFSGECGAGGWSYDTQRAVSYLSAPTSSAAVTKFPCLSELDSGSDVLVVKRVRGLSYTSASDLTTNKIYLRTNRVTAEFIKADGSTVDPATGEADWEYLPYLYFVEDAQLKRKSITYDTTATKFTVEENVLAEGVEQFHVVFGIDSNADEVADYFDSDPTEADLETAVIARIYVLARSKNEITGYTNDKSFRLGDRVVAAANDGYYRKVYSSSVQLKDAVTVQRFSGT